VDPLSKYTYWLLLILSSTAQLKAINLDSLFQQLESAQSDRAITHDTTYYQLNKSIGHQLMNDGNHDLAISYFLEAIESTPDTYNKVYLFNQIGMCFSYQKLYQEAIEYLNSGQELNQLLSSSDQLASIYHNLGESYGLLGEVDTMKVYFKEGIRVRYLQQDSIKASYDTGLMYYYAKEYNKALVHLREALALYPNPLLRTRLEGYIFSCYQGLGQPDQMLTQARIRFALSNQTEDIMQTIYGLNKMAIAFEAVGMHDSALIYKNQYLRENLAIKEIREKRKARSIDIFYKYQKRGKELDLLNVENEYQKEKLSGQKKRQQLFYAIGGLLLAMIAGLMYILRLRKDKLSLAQNQQRASEIAIEEKNTLLNEMHHRVKNNLQFIDGILYLQKNRLNDPDTKSIIQATRDRLKSIAIIHSQLYGDDNIGHIQVSNYVNSLVNHIKQSVHPKKITIETNVAELLLYIDDAIAIALVINELVTNAIKHALSDELIIIVVVWSQVGTFIIIEIRWRDEI